MLHSTRYIPTGYILLHEDEHCAVYGSPDGLTAIAYHGKATHHDWYYRFSSPEARDTQIASYAEGWKKHAAAKIERAAARKIAANPFKVGDILYRTWGYDQTNVNFYEVVKTTKATVTVMEVAQDAKETGYLSGIAKAIAGAFRKDAKALVKRVNAYGGAGDLSPWDGKPVLWTAYA